MGPKRKRARAKDVPDLASPGAPSTSVRSTKLKKIDGGQSQPSATVTYAENKSTRSSISPQQDDVCAVCLDNPVHPVSLKCQHIFCFLCAKGLKESKGFGASCPLCRETIDESYFRQKSLLERSISEFETFSEENNQWQWFYEGRNGWWKFEKRCSDELEANFQKNVKNFDMLICGNLYAIDLENLVQRRKDFSGRKRKIKRDVVIAQCKGVAGLVAKS